ncbi:MAG: hypothetical protein ABGY75_13680 [Gemmataceae bacterium]
MRRLFATAAVLAAAAAPAVACINDSELPGHEREFRSSYQNGRSPSPSPSAGWQSSAPTVLYASGATLAVAAGFVTFRRFSAKG